jgi:tetratricopeptide (TPR) repeat protein
MKKSFEVLLVSISLIIFTDCKSGLVTTSNSCYNLIQSSQAQNRAGDYTSALANFNEVLKKCNSYDAKTPAYAGKAEALNGLHQYNDALAAAQEGLKLDKSSIDNLFEKASAELGLGMTTEAKADLQSVISLTEKNRNTAQRATIYAKMAALDSRQKQYADAQNNVRQAISLDPNNLDLYILQGDIYTSAGNYSSALESYNLAISKGKNDGSTWTAKVESIIKMYQAKYGTRDANTLAAKMNGSEKKNLCDAIKTGIGQGMKNMNIEMVQVTICK